MRGRDTDQTRCPKPGATSFGSPHGTVSQRSQADFFAGNLPRSSCLQTLLHRLARCPRWVSKVIQLSAVDRVENLHVISLHARPPVSCVGHWRSMET
jgi:hypothetical protein